MDKRIIDLYDEYTHAPLDRRVFLSRLSVLAGGAAAATAVLPLLESRRVEAALVAPDDARITAERVTFAGSGGEMKGLLVAPKPGPGPSPKPLGAVIVIHENRGLTPHIEDVTRRIALEGFLAFGADLLSPLGGTPADEDAARTLIGKLDAATTLQNLVASLEWLAKHPKGNGKVGAVGFCWGGGMVGQLAVKEPRLAAGVVYYGRQPDPAGVPAIKAPLLLHYAGLDTRINEGIPAFEAALKAAGTRHTVYVYEGANHAFNNDTSAARYHKETAELAWGRTITFLKSTVGAGIGKPSTLPAAPSPAAPSPAATAVTAPPAPKSE